MERRLLVMGAGGGPTNNLVRSLTLGDSSFSIIGCHSNRFTLKNSQTERNYLLPSAKHPAFIESLNSVIKKEHIDLLIPNSDADVKAISALQASIHCRIFLPRSDVIELCQDKYELITFLQDRSVSVPASRRIASLDVIDDLFVQLTPHTRLWCRLSAGQGAMGAMLVKNPEQTKTWIRYWEETRGISPGSFMLSEYLPGRDFACQALFKEGRLVLMKSYERLTYLGAGAQPTGFTSLAALAKTVFAPALFDVCAAAVRALDSKASGVFCFDVKENVDGTPCVTEINAGRFGLSTNIFDIPGRHNTAVTYVRLAFDEPVDIADVYDAAEGYYMVRDYDTVPVVLHADKFFEGIDEVWGAESPIES